MNSNNEIIICILVLESQSLKEGQCCLCFRVTIIFFLDVENSRVILISVQIRKHQDMVYESKINDGLNIPSWFFSPHHVLICWGLFYMFKYGV